MKKLFLLPIITIMTLFLSVISSCEASNKVAVVFFNNNLRYSIAHGEAIGKDLEILFFDKLLDSGRCDIIRNNKLDKKIKKPNVYNLNKFKFKKFGKLTGSDYTVLADVYSKSGRDCHNLNKCYCGLSWGFLYPFNPYKPYNYHTCFKLKIKFIDNKTGEIIQNEFIGGSKRFQTSKESFQYEDLTIQEAYDDLAEKLKDATF